MRHARHAALVVVAALVAAAPLAATSDDRLPFDPTTSHIFNSTTTTGTTQYSTTWHLGQTFYERHFTGGDDDGLVQYWSENAEHDKFFHGFTAPPLDITYDPPLLWIDAPLFLGKFWDSSTMVDGKPLALHFEVTLQIPVTVPAGTFDILAVTIAPVDTLPIPLPGKPGSSLRADGRHAKSAGFVTRDCYAADIGLVISESDGRIDQLAAIAPIDAVMPQTWSGIRALYRP